MLVWNKLLRNIILALALIAACSSISFAADKTISSRITKAIIGYLVTKDPGYADKRIEVEYKYAERTFADLKSRNGDVTFAVAELYPDFKPLGNIIIPIQVSVDGVPKDKIFLRSKVSVFDNIVVAKKRLKRGDEIGTLEAAVEVRDIAQLNTSIIKDLSLVLGKEAKTYISSGNPIYDWMIKERAFVKKNERVKITAIMPGVLVVADGMSLQDASMGMDVKVKNLSSGRELIATVSGTEEVLVK